MREVVVRGRKVEASEESSLVEELGCVRRDFEEGVDSADTG